MDYGLWLATSKLGRTNKNLEDKRRTILPSYSLPLIPGCLHFTSYLLPLTSYLLPLTTYPVPLTEPLTPNP